MNEYEMETGMKFRKCEIGIRLDNDMAYNDWEWDKRIEMGSRMNPGMEVNQREQIGWYGQGTRCESSYGKWFEL